MGAREDVVKATQEGAAAGQQGEPATVCPYPATSILRTAWIRGYARARPVADADEQDVAE
ncbi:Rmf/CrpP fold protein [Streptomyces sp. NPDC097610]|uniref:Rmf/CrpP fold protein n=1 Tax=Streptomyces sp. NPDC097610 TaxID=3157227 RepID=UPI003324CE23